MNTAQLLLVLLVATTALASAACVRMPKPSEHVGDAPVVREYVNVDLGWVNEEHDRPYPLVAVVVLPKAKESKHHPGKPHPMAITFARLLEAELAPAFERTHAVRPEDDRLNNPPEGYHVLVLETRIVELHGGSNWLRWLVGFGMGGTRVQIDGRARYIGEESPVAVWSDRTGSSMPRPGGSHALLLRDLTRLAHSHATFITEEVLAERDRGP